MLALALGLLSTVGIALGILLLVAIPHLRRGSRILTPQSERQIQAARERTAAAASTATQAAAQAATVATHTVVSATSTAVTGAVNGIGRALDASAKPARGPEPAAPRHTATPGHAPEPTPEPTPEPNGHAGPAGGPRAQSAARRPGRRIAMGRRGAGSAPDLREPEQVDVTAQLWSPVNRGAPTAPTLAEAPAGGAVGRPRQSPVDSGPIAGVAVRGEDAIDLPGPGSTAGSD